MPRRIENFRPPSGYRPIDRPGGWDRRPAQLDRPAFNHNFRAERVYRIGPYLPPRGYVYRTWYYGSVLPPLFWTRQYWVNDFWLFGLDVPPVGFEWVRYGPDALLINTATGMIEQTVYGLFG